MAQVSDEIVQAIVVDSIQGGTEGESSGGPELVETTEQDVQSLDPIEEGTEPNADQNAQATDGNVESTDQNAEGTTDGNVPPTDPNAWVKGAPLQVGRYGAAAAAATVWNELIYVAGGESVIETSLKDVEEFDPSTNTWTLMAPLNEARSRFGLIAVDGFLQAFGGKYLGWAGIKGSPKVNLLWELDSVEEYNVQAGGQWSKKADWKMLKRRADFGLIFMGAEVQEADRFTGKHQKGNKNKNGGGGGNKNKNKNNAKRFRAHEVKKIIMKGKWKTVEKLLKMSLRNWDEQARRKWKEMKQILNKQPNLPDATETTKKHKNDGLYVNQYALIGRL